MNININPIGSKKELVERIKDLGSKINEGINSTNSINDSLFDVIQSGIVYSQSLTEGLKLMSNQAQDLMILDGDIAKKVSLLDNVQYKSSNIDINKNDLSISISKKKIESLKVSSIDILINNNKLVFDKKGFISKNTNTRLSSEYILNAKIDIAMNEEVLVSEIAIDSIGNGTYNPKIKSITCISESGAIYYPVILNSGQTSYQLTSSTETIYIEPTIAKNIQIELIKDDSYIDNGKDVYEIILKGIDIFSSNSNDSGEIIFGPIKSESTILKAGIYFKSDRQIRSYISQDMETWYEVGNINSVEKIDKILNINNIDVNSIATDIDFKDIYIKINIEAYNQEPKNNSVKQTVRSAKSDNGYIEISYGENEKVSNIFTSSGDSYGRVFATNKELSSIKKPFATINKQKLSLKDSDAANIFTSSVARIQCDPDKLYIDGNSAIPTMSFPGTLIHTYSLSSPILRQDLSVNTNEICCLKLKVKSDTYILRYNSKEWQIELHNGFSRSIDSFNFLANENEYIDIYSLYGKYIGRSTAQLVNGEYVISLYDIFFEAINDINFNKYYPFGDVKKYSISAGKIVNKDNNTETVTAYIHREQKIIPKISVEATNKIVSIDRQFASQVKNENLDEYAFKYFAKLKHAKIIKGSVQIDSSDAAVSNIRQEVPYVDGKTEFNQFKYEKRIIQNESLNIIYLNNINVDGDIVFSGEYDLFVNKVYSEEELIFRGDYLVDSNGIKLPPGIYTSLYIATEIIYEAKNINIASGLYSVDYINGMIFTQNKIYENVKVHYMHSTLYATYMSVKPESTDNYRDTGQSVIIFGESAEYMIETIPKEINNLESKISPVVKDIELRYTIWANI